MSITSSLRVALASTATLAIAACANMSAAQGGSGPRLVGREWVVEDIAGRGVIDGARASLTFGDDGRLSGNASCNRLIGTYVIKNTSLTINRPGLTMMLCPPAMMDQERRLVDVLAAVRSYRVDRTGALILTADKGATITAR